MDRDGGVAAVAGHWFYERLNQLLEEAGFDTFVEKRSRKFYAPTMGRPSLAPGMYFRLLLYVAAFNLSLVLHREVGVGTPRGLQDLVNRLFFCFCAFWVALESLWESSCRQPTTSAGKFRFSRRRLTN